MVYLLFLLTGASALIYEVVWSRQFGLLFGHTAQAAAVVLGAYFSGMTVGYLLAARLARRLRNPLRGYAVAELVAAGWALAIPAILAAMYAGSLSGLLNNENTVMQVGIRAIVSFLLMLPATAAIGASLPFVVQYLSLGSGDPSRRITLAYSINTLGAFGGVLLATFVLILHTGISGSLQIAVATGTLCAIVAWLLPTPAAETADDTAVSQTTDLPAQWYVLAAVSGFGTLGLQVLYNRMFSLVFHNSTYSFGSIIAVFLIALSLASWWVSRSRTANFALLAARSCLLGSVAILLGVFFFQRATRLGYLGGSAPFLGNIEAVGGSFAGYVLGSFLLIILSIALPVVLIGMQLPWCMRMLRERRHDSGRLVGRLVALNTVSAAAGALAASFILLPLAGLWHSFMLMALLYLLTGGWLLIRNRLDRELRLGGAAALLAVIALAAFTNWPVVTKVGEKLMVKETAYGVISVISYEEEGREYRYLRQNNHYTLGATKGMESELRQGRIPMLLHPDPRDVCFLGLATGITASAALDHPELEHLVAAELIPEVVEAARLFSADNNDIHNDPRSEILVNDARHYLYGTGRDFDLVISDLFVPWHSQTGYLYTVEHYAAAQQRLKPGGMFCQWLPLYQLDRREFEMICDSMAAVFPGVTLWRGEFDSQDFPLVLAVGAEQAPVLDADSLTVRIAGLPMHWEYPDPNLNDVQDLYQLYIGDWPRRADARLNTDNHPLVEFLAPVSNRNDLELRGSRLADYYWDVLIGLPREAVRYIPRPGEEMPDPNEGIHRQLGQ